MHRRSLSDWRWATLPSRRPRRYGRGLRIREERKDPHDRGVLGERLARVVLVAASVTLLLGFVPTVFERDDAGRDARVAQCDSIRPSDPNRVPSDFQLTGIALFGFCREAIRRRVKPLVLCFCKRREED